MSGRTARAVFACACLVWLLLIHMLLLARADPVVRRVDLALQDWPASAPPMRLVLLSDLHVAGPDTPPERLAWVVRQVNALRPDIVILAGDFVTEKGTATRLYGADAAIAPLALLRPRIASIAVLGNHDHWLDAASVRDALARAHVRVLDNAAMRIGPLAIGGVDDRVTHHGRLAQVRALLRAAGGPRVLIGHSPDDFPAASPDIDLMLAGHTHCGQIVLPLYGAIATASAYGERYRCGLVRQGRAGLIVTAGIGTSILPLRLGAAPDLRLIDLGPVRNSARVQRDVVPFGASLREGGERK